MKRLCIAAALAGMTLSSTPIYGQQPTAEDRFVAAAQARDFETMRHLLDSPVSFLDGREISATEFIEYISNCRAMNAGGGIMGWICPAGFDGKARRWVLAGGMRDSGDKVRLSGLGDPGFPLSEDGDE